MTFKQLEAFYWAARLGSFSGAATRLHITQPTLSKRIAELEGDLGGALFDRSGHRAILTDVGRSLVERAGHILEIEGLIRADMNSRDTVGGLCRLGISELIVSTWFPLFVDHATQVFPECVVEPYVDVTSALEHKLEKGDLDCTVNLGCSTSPQLSSAKIGDMDYQWMAAPSRLSRGTFLRPSHFTQHPVISIDSESRLSSMVNRWVLDQGIESPRTLCCNSLTAMIALTIAGVGISCVPRTYLTPFVRSCRLVELRSEVRLPSLSYYFQWRKDDHRRVVTEIRNTVLATADFSRTPLWAEVAT